MLKIVMNTAVGIIVICIILLRVQANDYDDFVSRTLLHNCPYTGTCSRSPKSVFQYDTKTYIPCCQQCSCENNCRARGTCCYDLENHNLTKRHGNAHEKCLLPVYPGDSAPNNRDEAYFTVTSCPANRPIDEIVRLCEMPIPQTLEQVVLVSDDKGTLYRNMYCAQCNGVLDFTQWKAEVTCKMFDSTKSLNLDLQNILNSRCRVRSKMPDNFPKLWTSLCYAPYFTECNVTGQWKTYDSFLDLACKDDQYGIYLHLVSHFALAFDVYRNIFCYLCNADMATTETVCNIEFSRSKFGNIPFSAILNLRQSSHQDIETAEKNTDRQQTLSCGTKEIFDKYTETCRELFCPIDSFVLEGDCVKKFNVTGGFGVKFYFGFKSANPFIASKEESELIVRDLSEKTTLSKRLGHQGCTLCRQIWTSEPSMSSMMYIAHFYVMVTAKCSIHDIWKLVEKVDNSLVIIKSNISTMTFNKYLLSKETASEFEFYPFATNETLLAGFKRLCPSAKYISLHDMICPRIQISGFDMVKGLEYGYIRNNGQFLKHNLHSYDEDTLANKTFDICLNDYIQSEHYQIAGCKGQDPCFGCVVIWITTMFLMAK